MPIVRLPTRSRSVASTPLGPCVRRNKYAAVRSGAYASKAEAAYAGELKLRRHAGQITGLVMQPVVYLTAARIRYVADFLFLEDGQQVWVDVKGMETPVFRLKARLWKHYGPGVLRIVKRQGENFVVDREIRSTPTR